MTMDDTMSPPGRPAFDALVADLRHRAQEQHVAKARAAGAEVMRRAEMLFKAGTITSDDYIRLASHRLRLALPGQKRKISLCRQRLARFCPSIQRTENANVFGDSAQVVLGSVDIGDSRG